MPDIILSATVAIPGGPTLSLNRAFAVDAYDRIDVTVPAGQKVTVSALPGDADTVQFLLIAADRYGDKLTYKVDAAATAIALDGPHQFAGNGAARIFHSLNPQDLEFENTDTTDVAVQILVGRDATP